MNIRLIMGSILLVFFPFIGYEVSYLDVPEIAKLYGTLGWIMLIGYLVATGFSKQQ